MERGEWAHDFSPKSSISRHQRISPLVSPRAGIAQERERNAQDSAGRPGPVAHSVERSGVMPIARLLQPANNRA